MLLAQTAINLPDTYSAPGGWLKAINQGGPSGTAEIWYYPNNPGGISSVNFTTTAGDQVYGEMTEWSGIAAVAPLDQSHGAVLVSATSGTVSTTGATTQAGELAVTDVTTSGSVSSFSPGAGWAHVINQPGSGYVADYLVTGAPNVISETIGYGGTPAPADATITTFRPIPNSGGASVQLSGAGYSVVGQGTIAFSSTALDGTDQTLNKTATAYIEFSDASGSGLGWNVTAQVSTLFTNTIHNVNDGVLNSTTTVTSASAPFTGADRGLLITGGTIPAGATITSVTNATTVVISAAATTTVSSVNLRVLSTMPAATISLSSRTALTCDGTSTCSAGTDPATITYPALVPNTPSVATKIFNALANTGMGNEGFSNAQTWALGGTLAAKAVRVGVYTATLTYTMSAGV